MSGLLYDSHCHLAFSVFEADREAVLRRASEAGIGAILVPAYSPSGWGELLSLRERHPDQLRLALGVHPYALGELEENSFDEAVDELSSFLEADASLSVGECGLDKGLERRGGPSLQRQERALLCHLRLAKEHDRPLVLHLLGAHDRALCALAAHAPLRGVIHSYSGSAELVRAYAELGLSFGFSPALARPGARRPLLAARAVPEERLLVETDSPDQSAREGERGEPSDLPAVLAALARARGQSAEELGRITAANARALFG